MSATGGSVTNSGSYKIHSFTNVGATTFTVTSTITIDYIVVAGGGSGGVDRGGGGGGGGVLTGTRTLTAGNYTITVGEGGPSVINNDQGIIGGSSSISNLVVATGGGGGGGFSGSNGGNGGSGGGGYGGNVTSGGTGINGQGFAGFGGQGNIGGGGGGAGAAALNQNGAIGISSTITGATTFYAGGGGGGSMQGTGGFGIAYGGIYQQANGTYGGGNGANTLTKQPFQDAAPNTGGGGGGQSGFAGTSGAGGSGIVVIRYMPFAVLIAPTNVTALAGNGQATVSWSAPTNNGGSAITSYTVTTSPSGLTATANGSTTTATVTGLTNGTAYTFTVVATNAIGNSIASAVSNSVIPNNKVAISNDGKVVAVSSSLYSDISRGRVYVYELSYNQASSSWNQLGLSSEIIVGASNEDQFGWDIALSSDGRVVAGSSIASDALGTNSGQVRLFELSNNNRWVKKGSDINGPRPGSESGYSISLAGSGNSIAIGAWKDNLNGTNAGAVRVYDFSASINDWRQKGQTIAGVVGSFEGYSTALSLDGQTLASSSIASIASGGTITSTDSYTIHTFTTVGTSTFTATSTRTVEVLIVGGGGGGGFNIGGGGGGGGVIYIPAVNITSGTNYSIVVGDGGNPDTNGQNSTAFSAVAVGGGRGGTYDSDGVAGGSGGGAGSAANDSALGKGGATNGNSLGPNSGFTYGNRGGNMTTPRTLGLDPTRAAGGGGAGGQGLDTNPNITGNTGQTGAGSGGVGVVNAILGPSYYWGGGGGGLGYTDQSGGWGGLGGGGGGAGRSGGGIGGGSALNSGANGGSTTNTNGGAGGLNTGGGGGGGGGGHGTGNAGKGGSGIVVIRYINSAIINTYTISGSSWIPKGIIQGSATNNSYFGRSMKLSANGNTIVIGALGYGYINEYRITPSYEFISTTMSWQAHRDNALTVFGRDLAVILNASQNTQANALRNNTNAFIGGRRVANPISATGKTAADWEWVTGDAWSYENFSNGEPNGTGEKAVHFWTSEGKWNDIPLENNYPAIYMYYKVRAQQVNVERAYVYGHQGGTTWTQLGQTIREISGGIDFGSNVNISNDGTIISVGTNDISSNRGYVNVYKYVNNYWTLIGNTINGKVATFKAGLHALSGDGTTLIQSNANYYSVYGINKTLALNSPATTISGNLIVLGNAAFNSLDISRNHSYSSNGYSYKVFESPQTSAIMKEYYSDVTSTKHLKVQILGNGNITNRNNSYRALSDSRLKENIVTSGPKLEDLLKVRVVNYSLKGSNSSKYIGVLAQELEGVFPNLVTEIEPSPKDVEEGRLIKYKAVNYSSFDALLIKSLQEQNAMLKNITQRIETLEKALEDDD
jgi:hypothetical protein